MKSHVVTVRTVRVSLSQQRIHHTDPVQLVSGKLEAFSSLNV